MRSLRASRSILFAVALAAVLGGCERDAHVVLQASHQWPAGIGDPRDEMVQIIARDVAAADVGLEIRVYPGEALYKAREQWSALERGQLDITALPLDYASGRYPQFNATLMPGLVKDYGHAQRLDDSPFMAEIKRIIGAAGVRVLADSWIAGGFVSAKGCILEPDDIKGQVARAAGPAFERMLVGAGASISSMPSSEIYTAMQTGVLDAAVTSSSSFVSFRIYEQAKCFTAPGEHALWFMYEPVLIAERSWERLDPAQQQALSAASQHAEEYFYAAIQKQDAEAEKAFADAGVEVVHMTAEQAAEWRGIAAKTSYEVFADQVPGGRALIDSALAVE
jgi:TRAP-type C4-dicarboxylate transport system substrate-binding protein